MNIVIVDDEKSCVKALADKLNEYDDTNLVGVAYNGMDGLKLMSEQNPDLMFLDIELPDISGIEFLERIESISDGRCRVVMYTAHGRYMLPAFRNKAFDYLMKPIDDAELRTILRRACIDRRPNVPQSASVKMQDDTNPALEALNSDSIAKRNDGKFLIYTNSVDFLLVDIRDIGVFTYNHELRTWEVTVSGRKDPIRLKRNVNSDMIMELDDTLVRVSQKHIINLGYLIEVADNTCHFYPPFEKLDDVKVGRFFRKKLIDRFSSFVWFWFLLRNFVMS